MDAERAEAQLDRGVRGNGPSGRQGPPGTRPRLTGPRNESGGARGQPRPVGEPLTGSHARVRLAGSGLANANGPLRRKAEGGQSESHKRRGGGGVSAVPPATAGLPARKGVSQRPNTHSVFQFTVLPGVCLRGPYRDLRMKS